MYRSGVMKIIVCIKQVPYIDQLKFDFASKRVIREGVESEINPFDKRALTHAIQLKNQIGAETIVVTMGPPQAESALREALAMGADRAVHLLGREFAGADTLATARALAAAIRSIGFDLILCGKYATDAETAQVPPMLAEFLDVPQITGVTQIEWKGRAFAATRELETGFETWQGALPALMTAAERLCKPLRVTPQDLERVRDAPIEILQAARWGDTSQFGLQGSPTWVESIESIEPPRKRVIRQASDGVARVVRETLDDLRREGLFGEWKRATHETILPGAVRDVSQKGIWVVAEVIRNALRPVTFELLGRAVQLAEQSGGHVGALVLGANARQFADALAAHGADQILIAEHPALQHYATEPYARIVADAIVSYKPFAVLVPSTANGRDLAPRVAARLNVGLTGDVIGLHFDAQGRLVQLKPAFGGNIVAPILSKTTPVMATVRPGMLTPAQADETRRAEIVAVPVTDTTTRVTLQKSETVTDESVHLDNAEIVIGIGMGVGGPENLAQVEELCRVLDAHIGATRKVVDSGWLPRQLQIGLTGRSIAPHLYIALGVRGAFNHTVGIQRAGLVCAVNNDPNAAIFKHCDYGIVGDWQAVVGEMLRAIGER
jgi:electron transfer flavoprotein alpha subunit